MDLEKEYIVGQYTVGQQLIRALSSKETSSTTQSRLSPRNKQTNKQANKQNNTSKQTNEHTRTQANAQPQFGLIFLVHGVLLVFDWMYPAGRPDAGRAAHGHRHPIENQ